MITLCFVQKEKEEKKTTAGARRGVLLADRLLQGIYGSLDTGFD
jgi:hypothetical protein